MGERQAKVNEKRQYFKGWETLVNYKSILLLDIILLMIPSYRLEYLSTLHQYSD